MNRSKVVRTVLAGVALLAVGSVVGAEMKVGTGDVIGDRQRIMKLQGASMRDISDKAKAGNIEGIAVNAETLAVTAINIAALFPQGSMSDKSKAKPEIWQKWPEFEAAAKKLQVKAEELRDTARSKNAEATQEMLKTFGRETCAPCHDAFRVPPPRS
jgi:cytochrome c556